MGMKPGRDELLEFQVPAALGSKRVSAIRIVFMRPVDPIRIPKWNWKLSLWCPGDWLSR